MKKCWKAWGTILCVALCMPCGTVFAGDDEVLALMRVMPADFTLSMVVVDFEKLDKSITAMVKRLDPESSDPGLLKDLKDNVGIAEWADFSKPTGVASPTLGGGEWEGLVWMRVPDFATKVKTLEGAVEEGGVWQLPSGEGMDAKPLFVMVRGDYVVASPTKEALSSATKEGKSLAEDLKARVGLLRGRDALIHLNIDPVRARALDGIAQASQMAPMMAMMAGQQGGTDPTLLTAVFMTAFDTAKNLVEQVAYVDIAIGLNDEAGDLTVATGYVEGPIKKYLADQKPAGVPLLVGVEEQPYFIAAGFHAPRADSPLVDYLSEKMLKSMELAAMAAPPGEGETQGPDESIKKAVEVTRELYRLMEGMNMVAAMTPDGLRGSGDYVAKDPKALFDLIKESLTTANPLMRQFGGGAEYEALGSKKIGDVTVEEYGIKIDEASPAAEAIRTMYGENPRFAIGIVGGRVHFSMGGEEQINRVFGGKVSKPFASGALVSEALAKLPEKRNMVALVDLAGGMAMFGPMIGLPPMGPIPPGPPIAVSVSLAGEPVRLDVHVPLRAIERVKQALAPQEDL